MVNFKHLSGKYGNLLRCGILMGMSLIMLNACVESKGPKEIVINEIMAANHTCLTAEDGNLYDWLEIKNNSSETVSLAGYSLIVEKNLTDSADNGKKSKTSSWNFPDIEMKPGECKVIFASKKDTKNPELGLHASFKLPAGGGKVKLMDGEDVVSELSYGFLEDDESYHRLDNGKFEKSFEPTPGFDNNEAGYEAYCKFLDEQRQGPIRLWEVQVKDHDGSTWIEVKNISDKDVDLKDFGLATKKKKMDDWHFPSVVLKPGEIYLVDCKKAKLKVGKSRSVMLTKDGKFIDGLCPVQAPYGVSVGRVNGKFGAFFFPSPTKGTENTTEHYRFITKRPSFDPTPGVYADTTSMKVLINTNGRKVHYTTDGSEPTMESPVYKDSISIQKTTTIRAFCESDSTHLRSEPVTATFIFGAKHDLPVFNIIVSKYDLYDNRGGIYARGPGASSEYPHYGANYWKKVWKNAHIEFYDKEGGGFSEDCQLAIFGGFSRVLQKKSFKVKFTGTRGPKNLTYDLYGEGEPIDVENFVLRCGSQDISGVMVRDEFFTSLMQPESPTLLTQPYRPVALYINGEYFGLYYIREKIDRRFVARHLDVSNDSVSILMSGQYCEEGSAADYHQIMSYVKSHNMAEKEHYEWVKSKFDVMGLIDFKLGEIYASNTDVGNVRYVRSTDSKSDKKWYLVYYDLDATWADFKPAAFYLRVNTGTEPIGTVSIHNVMISHLLKNKEFRQLFLERLSVHMHKTFSTKNTTEVFDNLTNTIKNEMVLNCKRWPGVLSYASWERHVAAFREKFKDRNKIVLNDLRKELNVTAEEEKKYFSDLGF